jgi:origin recognition complex subunit 1
MAENNVCSFSISPFSHSMIFVWKETNPFTYIEINGLRIPEPSAAYNLLWETVSGHDVASDGHLKNSSKEALKQLTKHFSAGARAGPAGHAW